MAIQPVTPNDMNARRIFHAEAPRSADDALFFAKHHLDQLPPDMLGRLTVLATLKCDWPSARVLVLPGVEATVGRKMHLAGLWEGQRLRLAGSRLGKRH